MKNSLVVFILIIIIFISVFPIISIKAQNDNNSIQIIYAQTFVKNAEDNLVSYMESDRIGSPPAVATPRFPRYQELVTGVGERLGWDLSQFRATRLELKYPPLGSMVLQRFALPERA